MALPLEQISNQEKLNLILESVLSGQPDLNALVSLASDANDEIRQSASQAIDFLSDVNCELNLTSPNVTAETIKYFLNPEHFRPTLLPILLNHESAPEEAVLAFVRTATLEIIPHLLENLDLLKTSALVGLRDNPGYRRWQWQSSVSSIPQEKKLAIAKGEQPLPDEKRLATLVLLASDPDEEIGRAADNTLAKMEDVECIQLLADPSLEPFVARYFLNPTIARPGLMPILLVHESSPPDAIQLLAFRADEKIIPALLENLELLKTPALISLRDNPTYLNWQKEPPQQGVVVELDLLELMISEAEAEEAKPFTAEVDEEEKAGGLYNRISKMTVAQRVKLALLGNREERGLLIKDSSKSVCRAVLGSPKVTDSEIENFSAMKNVSQDVLRLISVNRKFMKSYAVMKNLVKNPRLPIDIGLPLLHRLIINDLHAISRSKEVPDVIRKMAEKMYKTRRP